MENYRNVSPFTNILPSDLFTGFVGRIRELAEIKSAFERNVKGIVILGMGGIGKTSLAQMAAHQLSGQFPGGTYSTSASWAESPEELMMRVLPSHATAPSLLVIDDAEVFEEEGIDAINEQLRTSQNLRLILTSRKDLSLPHYFHRIHLRGLSRREFQDLLTLRNAVAHNQLDDKLAERLFELAGGNALFASLAADAVKNGVVNSWQELFQYVRSYSTPGIVGTDGQPLTRESVEYKHIIVDASSTNSEILGILKRDPELIRKLSPRRFEEIVAEILDKQGYEVELTPASGDGGFDIYAAKKERIGKFLYLVECKRYLPPNKVGVEIVRALYGVVQSKRATAGAIVTTSFFTSGAEAFQREAQHQLSLNDYIVLQKWIDDFPLLHKTAT